MSDKPIRYPWTCQNCGTRFPILSGVDGPSGEGVEAAAHALKQTAWYPMLSDKDFRKIAELVIATYLGRVSR